MHNDSVVAKAYQRANATLRCFVSRDAKLLIKEFTMYVRPILDSSVLSGDHKQNRILKMQRKFKDDLACEFSKFSYSERLHKLRVVQLGIATVIL